MKFKAIAVFICLSNLVYGAENPKSIMQKSILAGLLDSMHASKVRLKSQMKSGAEKTKEYSLWRTRIGNSERTKTMSRFHAPAKIKGQGVLFIEGVGTENDIRLYLPAYKRVRRIERSMQSGSFMGTVFSYSDMTTPDIENFNFKYIKKEKCPTEKSKNCHVIEMLPKNRDIMDRRGYAKNIYWIREDNFMTLAIKGYNEKAKLTKTLVFSKFEKIKNNKWLAKKIKAKDHESSQTGEFEILEFKANISLNDNIFTEAFLKNP